MSLKFQIRGSARVFGILLLIGICLCSSSSGQARTETNVSSSTETAYGMHTVTFQTPNGSVKVHLPDDATVGDSISGSVIVDPAGKTDQDRVENQGELNGDVVEIQDQKVNVAGKVFKWIISTAASGLAYVILKDRRGRELSRTGVPIQPGPAPAAPSEFHLPIIGQTGRPVQVPGPFDGNSSTTAATIGGEEAAVLTEDPRKTVILSPSDVVGLTEIHVKKGKIEAKGTFRNVAVSLTAPKTTLRTGEQTTLTAEVRGLEGLQGNIVLQLTNRSPSVIGLEGGENQSVTIRSQDVRTGGIYTWTGTMTGREQGPFNLLASIFSEEALAQPSNPPRSRERTIAEGQKCKHDCKPPGSKQNCKVVDISLTSKLAPKTVNEKSVKDALTKLNILNAFQTAAAFSSWFEAEGKIAEVATALASGKHAMEGHEATAKAKELIDELHKIDKERWIKQGVDVTVIPTIHYDLCEEIKCPLPPPEDKGTVLSSQPDKSVKIEPLNPSSIDSSAWAGIDLTDPRIAAYIQKEACK